MAASATSLTDIRGVGVVVAALILGHVGVLYDMSARPDSVSNFSHGWARIGHRRSSRRSISMRLRRATVRENGNINRPISHLDPSDNPEVACSTSRSRTGVLRERLAR